MSKYEDKKMTNQASKICLLLCVILFMPGCDQQKDTASLSPSEDLVYSHEWFENNYVNKNNVNEYEEVDPIAWAKTSALDQVNWTEEAIDYAGKENWENSSREEKEEIISFLKSSWNSDFN